MRGWESNLSKKGYTGYLTDRDIWGCITLMDNTVYAIWWMATALSRLSGDFGG